VELFRRVVWRHVEKVSIKINLLISFQINVVHRRIFDGSAAFDRNNAAAAVFGGVEDFMLKFDL
jgi:hypothetical protein